jgi:hypothetical protein
LPTVKRAGAGTGARVSEEGKLSIGPLRIAFCRRPIFQSMLRPAYLSKEPTRPVPTKDGGTLRAVAEARAYMLGLSKDRELRAQWQRRHKRARRPQFL